MQKGFTAKTLSGEPKAILASLAKMVSQTIHAAMHESREFAHMLKSPNCRRGAEDLRKTCRRLVRKRIFFAIPNVKNETQEAERVDSRIRAKSSLQAGDCTAGEQAYN